MIGALALVAQFTWGAQALPLLTHADPTPGDSSRTELRIVAPMLHATAHLAGGHLRLHAMLDGEGWTMRGGELATGDWGEGFVDRRHPHTWAHELMASYSSQAGMSGMPGMPDMARPVHGLRWSLSAGKGFASFGTDDPMNRPPIVFPVNHHWAQILERAVVIGGAALGPLALEVSAFNGDEPQNYASWPKWDRFGDSWSTRVFVRPGGGVEFQASWANVQSPEHRGGSGLRHTMISVSARVDRQLAIGGLYAMAEWERTDEGGFFQYYAGLAEAQLTRGASRAYLRLERTDRPEEIRVTGDPFRSPRPHFENSNLGITRWTAVTGGVARAFGASRLPLRAEAIGEAEFLHVTSVTAGVFDPKSWWGRNDLWMISVGLRILTGQPAHRMGRYGVAAEDVIQPAPGHPNDEM